MRLRHRARGKRSPHPPAGTAAADHHPAQEDDPPAARHARAAMVQQLKQSGITDETVLAAIAAVPRHLFVPTHEDPPPDGPGTYDAAYANRPLQIGSGQTISAPDIVAMMAAALELTGAETVLEVGGGSGYAAAVLSRCAARVVTLERRASLAGRARATLALLDYTNVEVRRADGTVGAADLAPFDAISVAAMCETIPAALPDQLTPGGRLVCPVGTPEAGELLLLQHGRRTRLAAVTFVPLLGGLDR